MIVKLDVRDRKILSELDSDSRQPISQLAKKLKISKQNATYRINKLVNTGIITQFYTLVNFTALGYKPYKIFLRMNNLPKSQISKHLEEFRKTEYVVWTVHCDGEYDIIIGLIAKNTEHFRQIYFSILEKYQDKILASDHSTIISAHQSKKKYLSLKKEIQMPNNFYVDQKIITIDEIDSKILSVLAPNSRLPVIEISKNLSLTSEATRIRIKNLHKKKVILGSSILIDFNKIDYLSYKVLLNLKNKTKNNVNKIIQHLNSEPNILEVINTLGNWDLEIDLEVKTVHEFNEIITQIRTKFKDLILGYNTLIKYEEHSYNYYPIFNTNIK